MGRLFVVSQRVARIGEPPSAGGLAAALSIVVARQGATWLGPDDFPGAIPETVRRAHADWANGVLWPALHGVGIRERAGEAGPVAYRACNRLLARALAPRLAAGDRVWIHDFQLLTLGTELRRLGVTSRIGFFLHVPLAVDLARLPDAARLLRSLRACDSVGFQTAADLAAYRVAVRFARPRDFASAVSVDPAAVRSATRPGETRPRAMPMALGVDRLDWTKGLPQRLAAAQSWLAATPGWKFLQVIAPSRMWLPAQQALTTTLARTATAAGRLEMIHQCLPRTDVLRLMAGARIACVTPLRDGMNLVAKEYVAAQNPADPGVLVLSRTAGAARELDAALQVDPGDPGDIARALATAVRMRGDERSNRHRALWRAITRHTIYDWARDCLEPLAADSMATVAAPAVTAPISV